ncbi:MAG TPA: hypothetical protein VMU31_05875 [Rhizomicrobium sp.]|nr:hypothetical protein [Rhizomicrobium sp.]
MTSRLILMGVMSLALTGCALYRPSAGNPDGDAYLGHAGSTYEAAVNPPATMGQVTYNPSMPLPETTQPPVASGAALAAPPPARH